MSLIGRIFVVFFALILSLVAAGLGLAVGVMLPDFITLNSDPVEKFSFFAMAFFTTGFAGAYAFVPALVLIAGGAVKHHRNLAGRLWFAAGRGLRNLWRFRLLADRRSQGRTLEKSLCRDLITPTERTSAIGAQVGRARASP